MKVLIATDGSEFSKAAIEECCRLIALQNASIKVISVAELITPIATEPFVVTGEYIQETQALILKQTESFVTDAAEAIRGKFADAKVDVATSVVVGNPPRAIVEEAKDWGADLIVVGSHGYGFWGRMVIGSVSQSVINHSPCSVLVVRKPESPNGKAK